MFQEPTAVRSMKVPQALVLRFFGQYSIFLVPHQKDWESTALLRLQNAKVLYSPNLLALEPKTVLYCPKETLKANVSGTYSSQEHEGSSSIGFKVFWTVQHVFGSAPKRLGKYSAVEAPECKSAVQSQSFGSGAKSSAVLSQRNLKNQCFRNLQQPGA